MVILDFDQTPPFGVGRDIRSFLAQFGLFDLFFGLSGIQLQSMLHKGIRSQNFVWYFGLAITFAVSVVGCGVLTGVFSADSLAAFNSSNFGYRGAGVAFGVAFAGAFAGTLAGVFFGSSESIGLLF